MISVVIPACNEEAVIRRCLTALLDGLPDDGSEIVVACNGCTDRTVEIASSFGYPVTVVQTPVASKAEALNLGDRVASYFPRAYVDADIELAGRDLVRVAEVLGEPDGPMVAAPALKVDERALSPAARAYYRIWTRLPWVTDDLVGSGVYMLSEAGRARFDRFPPIIADDLFAYSLFAHTERRSVRAAEFVVRPPRTTRDLVHVQVRRRAGNREYTQHFPGGPKRSHHTGRMLAAMARSPRNWPDMAVYLAVTCEGRLRGWWKVRFGDLTAWERETGSRYTAT